MHARRLHLTLRAEVRATDSLPLVVVRFDRGVRSTILLVAASTQLALADALTTMAVTIAAVSDWRRVFLMLVSMLLRHLTRSAAARPPVAGARARAKIKEIGLLGIQNPKNFLASQGRTVTGEKIVQHFS